MLRVDRIDSYYGEYQALCDVSFHVKEKEIATIVGNNGAGKTTILKSLSGLVKPRRGIYCVQRHEHRASAFT